MRRARTLRLTVLVAVVGLAGGLSACADDTEPLVGGPEEATEQEEAAPEVDADTVLSTADSDLGEVVVDAAGMTVYYFDADEAGSGVSACEGECLTMWPPVHAPGDGDPADVQVEGVTAEVGVIIGNDGQPQVTLDGRPVYLWVQDTAPGDVAGQGVEDVWWAVAPDGAAITGTASSGSGY